MADSTAGDREPRGDALDPVVEQLVRFVRATHTLNRLDARRRTGLPQQQLEAAMHVALSGGLTVGELAAALAVSPGWASRLADELVTDGHMVREQDAADRRIVRLRISPAMEAQCAEVRSERVAAVARALADASPAELAAFTRLLGRITGALEGLVARQATDLPPNAAAEAAEPESAATPVGARSR